MSKAAVKAGPAKRTRNDGRKVTTRQRLIDATMDIVRAEGPGALTTGKIANAAGIQQPGFYAHFKNVEECLRAAADQLTSNMMDAELRMRRDNKYAIRGTDGIPHSVERMKFALGLWLDNRRFTELMMRCRYDDSPLGESARQVLHRARGTLTEDLLELAVEYGISPRYLREIELMSALITAAFTDGLDLIVMGVATDVDAVATALARAHHHHVRGELLRMWREQHQGVDPVPRMRRISQSSGRDKE